MRPWRPSALSPSSFQKRSVLVLGGSLIVRDRLPVVPVKVNDPIPPEVVLWRLR